MEVLGLGLIVVAVIYLLSRISYGTDNNTSVCDNAWLTGGEIAGPVEAVNNKINGVMKDEKQKLGTKDLFLCTLTEMKCQYEIDEDDDERIVFGYQGEVFQATVSNDNPYVWIRDLFWMSIDQDDIDEMARLRRVINEANMNTAVTTVYTLWDDDKTFNVHSKSSFIFLPQHPNLVEFLRVELDAFFHAKQFIQIEMEKLRQKEGVE